MLYPWQILTRALGLRLAGRLPFDVDADGLRRDLEAVQTMIEARHHKSGLLYRGEITFIGLITAGGDVGESRPSPSGAYEKTEALTYCPNIDAFLDGLDLEFQRVRLIGLHPGRRLPWHYDGLNAVDGHPDSLGARLHVPIVTSPKAWLQMSHETYRWQPGEAWWADFSFPHRVFNGSSRTRVHLLMDVVINDRFLKLMPDWFWEQRDTRARAQPHAAGLCRAFYFYKPDYVPSSLRSLKRRLIGSAFSRDKQPAE